MKQHTEILIMILLALLYVASAAAQDNALLMFKLKPGATGKVCMDCHVNIQETVKKPFVHTPVKSGDCTGCHNPHTSSHGKLLAADSKQICAQCHATVIPADARSSHKPVAEGNCMKCHSPHASENRFNMLRAGNALCLDCHKAMGDTLAKVKHKHSPVTTGCLTCHLPHASSKAGFLLKDEVPALCTGCHKVDKPIFIKQHMNYPVAKARCTACHDPHGSDMPSLLYNNVHKPVASKMCSQCHNDATSGSPLQTKRSGSELCKECHSDMVNSTFAKNKVHWPLLGKQGCLTCHNPHAAKEKGLLKADLITVCGNCHKDTIQRQEKSLTKHDPIQKGNCMACHDPHGSNSQFLINKPSIIDVCGKCHDWQKHSTHPIGDKIKDKRNKNLTMQCLSCHRAHGTEYKHFIPFPTTSDLCTQCHDQYKR